MTHNSDLGNYFLASQKLQTMSMYEREGLEWRTEPPTEPGLFWVVANGEVQNPVEWLLDDGTGKPYINWQVTGHEVDVPFEAEDCTHWLGPLPVPEMPKG